MMGLFALAIAFPRLSSLGATHIFELGAVLETEIINNE